MTDSGAISPDPGPGGDTPVLSDPVASPPVADASTPGASDTTITDLANAIVSPDATTGPDNRPDSGAILRYGVITAIGSGANALHVQTDATGAAWLTYDVSYAPAMGDLVYLLQQGPVAHVGGQLGGTQPTPPPVGMMAPYCGTSAPPGWIFPVGQAISRTTYSALFALCGTTYGAGDGSTTFNVPNLTDRMPVGSGSLYLRGETGGSETRTLTTANLPSHTHGSGGSHTHSSPAHDHPGTAMAAHDHPGSAHSHTSGGTHSHTSGGSHSHTSGGSHSHGMTHDHTGTALAGHTHTVDLHDSTSKAVSGGTLGVANSTAVGTTTTSSTSGGTPNTTIYSGSTAAVDPGNTGSTDPGNTGSTDPGNTGSTTANVTSASAGTPNTASTAATISAADPGPTAATGSGTAFNNMPPYLGVNWILRALP